MRLQEQKQQIRTERDKERRKKTAALVMNIPDTKDENDENWIEFWEMVYGTKQTECSNYFCKAKMLNKLGVTPRHDQHEIVGAHVYIVGDDGSFDEGKRYIIPLCKTCNHASNNGVVMFLNDKRDKLAKLDD